MVMAGASYICEVERRRKVRIVEGWKIKCPGLLLRQKCTHVHTHAKTHTRTPHNIRIAKGFLKMAKTKELNWTVFCLILSLLLKISNPPFAYF